MSARKLTKEVTRRGFLKSALGAAGLVSILPLLDACTQAAPTPTPQVVEKEVEKVVTQIVEKEKVVEKEKTVEVVVTATAEPAPTVAPVPTSGQIVFSNYEFEGHGVGLGERWNIPCDNFEKANPGIKVIRKAVPSTVYWDKMLTELTTKTTTDLYYSNLTYLDQYLKMDVIEPLDEWMDTKALLETSMPHQQQLVRDGKTWGVVVGITSSAMYYNKDIFEKEGLEVPKTYEELLETARKLTKAPDVYGLGIPTANFRQINEPIDRFLHGHDTLWGKDKEVYANSEKNVLAIKRYKELVDAGVTPIGQNNPTLRPMMWEGKLAMWWDGPWMYGMAGKEMPYIDTARIPLPSDSSSGGVQIVIMPKNAANKALAGKFLDFYKQEEQQMISLNHGKIIPGRDKLDYEQFLKDNQWFHAFLDSAPAAKHTSAPGWGVFEAQRVNLVQAKISEMVATNRPVEDVLNELQTEFENLVKLWFES